jgi:hypothetical protein
MGEVEVIRRGGKAVLSMQVVEAFKSRLSGTLVLPSDECYDGARRVWNGMVDKRPA